MLVCISTFPLLDNQAPTVADDEPLSINFAQYIHKTTHLLAIISTHPQYMPDLFPSPSPVHRAPAMPSCMLRRKVWMILIKRNRRMMLQARDAGLVEWLEGEREVGKWVVCDEWDEEVYNSIGDWLEYLVNSFRHTFYGKPGMSDIKWTGWNGCDRLRSVCPHYFQLRAMLDAAGPLPEPPAEGGISKPKPRPEVIVISSDESDESGESDARDLPEIPLPNPPSSSSASDTDFEPLYVFGRLEKRLRRPDTPPLAHLPGIYSYFDDDHRAEVLGLFDFAPMTEDGFEAEVIPEVMDLNGIDEPDWGGDAEIKVVLQETNGYSWPPSYLTDVHFRKLEDRRKRRWVEGVEEDTSRGESERRVGKKMRIPNTQITKDDLARKAQILAGIDHL
ncbi:hypothetical protein IAR50_004474 [Cryptococcus sp. DSM 104548]